MGGVADTFQGALNMVRDSAEDLAREASELVERNKVLSAVGVVVNPTVLLGTYGSTQAPHSAVGVATEAILTLKEIPDLEWYYFLNPYSIYAGAAQRRREELRRQENAFANRQAEALAQSIAEYQSATAGLLAERATGELRLLQSRMAATYVGNGTFISDDKSAEWRMYADLYKIKLIDSDEWRRQRAYASIREPGTEEIEEEFISAARHFRSRY